MEEARKAALHGVEEGAVVIAEEQTAGRGRRHRSWISPDGGIALSVVLRPSMEHLPQMVMLASLAVTAAIEKVTGLKADIKWPNDVLIGDKKVSGILIENQLRGINPEFTIIGVGINANVDTYSYPEIVDIATSLSVELGKPVSRVQLIQRLMFELESLYLDLKAGNSLHSRWRKRMGMLGREVQIAEEGKIDRGVAEDVDIDGSLLLRRSDGSLTHIIAGDVSLRPISPNY